MKKSKFYILTFSAIAILVILAGIGALHYFYTNAREALWEQKMQSGRREVRELGILLEQQLQAGTPPDRVIDNLEQSILNTDVQSEFVCMYNTAGIELCHPNPSLIGMKIEAGNSRFSDGGEVQPFQDILKEGKVSSGIRTFAENANRSSEIVSVYPVKGTNWMLASHANIEAVQVQLAHLYQKFLTGTFILILLLTGSCFWIVRMMHRRYERGMDMKISGLNEELNYLGALNRQLEMKQQNRVADSVTEDENTRKRLLTYHKDEIITIDVADIAYIGMKEHTVSVLTFQRKIYTIGSSLDELMKEIDNDLFYRANRQYIVNVNAIGSIWVYGRNQLRIDTNPACPEPIIISKHKVSEFKKWLDR